MTLDHPTCVGWRAAICGKLARPAGSGGDVLVLTTGKGWVLAMLAMLSPKPGLRVAARGSGPGAKQRRPCPPLRAGTGKRRRDEGRPTASTPKKPCRAGVEQRAARKAQERAWRYLSFLAAP